MSKRKLCNAIKAKKQETEPKQANQAQHLTGGVPLVREASEFSENSFDEAEMDELEPNQSRSFSVSIENCGASRVKLSKLLKLY